MNGKFKKILALTAFFFLLMFLLGVLNRTGSLILLWKTVPLENIRHDEGHGYYAWVPDENIGRLSLPFFLKEDENYPEQSPLSVNEDIIVSIKESGGGAYRLLANNDLYFSASDDRAEEHEYSTVSPVIIRNRYLLVLFALVVLSAGPAVFFTLKERDLQYLRMILSGLSAAFFLLMLFPWDLLSFPMPPIRIGPLLVKPLVRRNAVFLGMLFLIILLRARLCGKSRLLIGLSVLILLSNTVWYFIPEWNWYGQRADSPAYLQHYTAKSIRTPGYPVFIEMVYRLTGHSGLAELRTETEESIDETLLNSTENDSLGLIDVTRAQKCVLAVAFLTVFAVFSCFYSPVWFVFAAQIIFSGGFLGVDHSYIMTETLSQGVLLLTAAAFLLTLRQGRSVWFLLLCLFSAAGILIRPANLFLVLPILIAAVFILRTRRSPVLLLAGCLLFAVLCAIPAVTVYRQYHVFVWMPTSGYAEIARAVDLLQPGDEEAFDDPVQREFCRKLLEKKEILGEADHNTYMWGAGVASAEEMGYDRITCSTLFGKVSRKIFLRHPGEFLSALWGSVRTAMERTRLRFGPVPFIAFALLFAVLSVVRISTDSFIGLTLMLEHLAHLCIFSVNQPERRYIYSTEILCLLGWLLIFITLESRLGRVPEDQN